MRVEAVTTLRALLKRFRAWTPVNHMLTGLARAFFRALRRPPALFVMSHLPRVGTVSAPLPNGATLKLRSRGDDWISNQVYWKGWNGYEPETADLFFRLASRARVVIDVGAHVGFFSLLAAHANRGAAVYAFEPLESIYDRLVRHIELNGLTNVHAVRSAVSDTTGVADFFHAAHEVPCSSSLSLDFMEGGGHDVVRTPVPVTTLDDFAHAHDVGPVSLVKIDTESTEPQVLAGMTDILRRDRPAIVCEILPGCGTEALLAAILLPLGYRFFLLTADGPVPQERLEGNAIDRNHLFLAAPLEEALGAA